MKVEVQEPHRFHTFPLPRGLTKDQARNIFFQHVKPKALDVDHFTYNPRNGLVQVTECRP